MRLLIPEEAKAVEDASAAEEAKVAADAADAEAKVVAAAGKAEADAFLAATKAYEIRHAEMASKASAPCSWTHLDTNVRCADPSSTRMHSMKGAARL